MEETALKEAPATPLSLSMARLEDSGAKGSLTHGESNYTVFEDKLLGSPSKVPTFLDSPNLGGNSVSQGGGDVLEGDPINLDCSMEHKDLGYLDAEGRALGDGVTTPHSVKTLLNTLSNSETVDDTGGDKEEKSFLSSGTSEGYVADTDQDDGGGVTNVSSDPLECSIEEDPGSHSLDFDPTDATTEFTPNQSMGMLDLGMNHKSEAIPGDVSAPAFEGEHDVAIFDFDDSAHSTEAQCDSAQYIGHGSLHSNPDSLHDQPISLLHSSQMDYIDDQSGSLLPAHHDDGTNLIHQLDNVKDEPLSNDHSFCVGSDQSDYFSSTHEQSFSAHYVASTNDQSDASYVSQLESSHDGAVRHTNDGTLDFEVSFHEELEQDAQEGDFTISSFQPRHASPNFELDKEPPRLGDSLDGVAVVNLDCDCEEYVKGGNVDEYIIAGTPNDNDGLLSPDFSNDPCPESQPPSTSSIDVISSDMAIESVSVKINNGYIEGSSVEGETEAGCLEGGSCYGDDLEPLSPPLFPHFKEFGVSAMLSGMTAPFDQFTKQHQQDSSFSCSTASSGYVLTSGGPRFCNSEQ